MSEMFLKIELNGKIEINLAFICIYMWCHYQILRNNLNVSAYLEQILTKIALH